MDVKKQIREKKTVSLAQIGKQTLCAAFAALAARGALPFGAMPFGFAALCCVDSTHLLGVAAGVGISLLFSSEPWIMLGLYVITISLRVIFSLMGGKDAQIFGEHLSMRIIAASTGAFGFGLYRLIDKGFLYYDLFGAILSILIAAFATFLWWPLTDEQGDDRTDRGYTWWRAAGFISLIAAAVWGVRDTVLFGVSVSALLCMFVTLYSTRRWGVGFGATMALLSGLCVSVTSAPLFVFSAVVYGLLCSVSPLLASLSSFGVGMAWAIYIEGVYAVTSLLPALMAASFAFYAVDKLYPPVEQPLETDGNLEKYSVNATDIALLRLDDAAGRIKLLCEGFSALSGLLAKDGAKGDRMLSGALLTEIGEIGGDEGIERYADYVSETLRTETPALEYKTVADYLAEVMAQSRTDFSVDTALSEKITGELRRIYPRYELRAIALSGHNERVTVLCPSESFLHHKGNELCLTIADVCGFPVRCNEVSEFEEQAYLTFTRRPVLEVNFFGKKQNSSLEDEFCGDSFGIIKQDDNGKVFAFINDGMGSGREAAVTSGLCAMFLQKLLPVNSGAGASVEVTLNMLNGFLRSRNTCGAVECASTVDLCELDLVNCHAYFYKCGAAPTYIFRDGSLFKLRSRTVPIGIVGDTDIGRIDMELCPNDVIVMVSDGVTQGREECPELFEHLRSRLMTHNAEQLADSVVEFAKSQGSIDDISVVVMKVDDTVGKR